MSPVIQGSIDLVGPLFAHSRDAVIVGNLDANRIVHWNPAAEALFGYSAQEATGKPFDTLIPAPVLRLQQVALDLHKRGSQYATGAPPIDTPVMLHTGATLQA